MKTRLAAAAAVLLALGAFVSAHRLDEYLQATMFAVEKDRVVGTMRLIPGVAVAPLVLASIGINADGVISEAEQRAYAERVLGDMSLTVDGKSLKPRLVSVDFPQVEEMKEGVGEIHIEFTADLPRGGANRKLVFENHHQTRIAAYLVNCLVPSDPDIRIIAQNRNVDQSLYQLEYAQSGGRSEALVVKRWPNFRGWTGAVGFT